MNIGVTVDGNKGSFVLEGKLTVQSSPELESAIGLLDASVSDIDLDLAGVTYVSSAGLRVFVACDQLAATRGGTMRLLHPCDEVMDVFEMTGFADVLKIER